VQWVLEREEQTFAVRVAKGPAQAETWSPIQTPANGLYEAQPGPRDQAYFATVTFSRQREITHQQVASQHPTVDFGAAAVRLAVARIFRFSAERMNVGNSGKLGDRRDRPRFLGTGNLVNVPSVSDSSESRTSHLLSRPDLSCAYDNDNKNKLTTNH